MRASAPPSAGVTDGQRSRSRARATGSAIDRVIVAALPGAPRWRQCACPRGPCSPYLGWRAQRVGAISIGSHRPAQAAKLDEGPNHDGEADKIQDDESDVPHPIADPAQNYRHVKDDEPPSL